METEDREYSDYETEEESPRTPRPRRTLGYAVHRFTVRTKDAAGAVRDAFEATGDRYKKAWDRVDKWADGNKIGRKFLFRKRKAKLSIELRAGTITFLMVAYVLALNPQILGSTGGTCDPQSLCNVEDYKQYGEACLFAGDNESTLDCLSKLRMDLTTATATTALISCFIMGWFANLPLALAPGMGINIYLAYQVVGQRVLTYQQAMTAIFLEGFIFMFLSMTGIRGGIIRYMPANIAFAASVGIGLLLAHTGLRNLGIIVFDPNTLVTLGGCPEGAHEHVFTLPGNVANATTDIADLTLAEPTVYACAGAVMRSATMWLGIGGGMLMAMLSAWRVKGALFIGIAFITVISWIPGHAASYLGAGSSIPGGAFRMQVFKQVVAAPSLSATALAWDWSAIGGGHFWLVLFTFLYIDLLDCTGILLAMASLLDDCMMQDAAGDGLLDVYEPFLSDKKEFKGQQWAFLSDGVGIVAGSMMGVTPVAVYLESAAGIEDGGRTGIVAIIVSFFFFVSLFFSPIFSSIPPYATGPALILVGVMLIAHVDRITWDDTREAVPAFLTIIIMPFTLSVAYGVIAGIVAYIALHLPQWLRQYVVTPAFRKLRRKKSSIGEVENNGPPSNTSSQRQVRRRPVHRKVFGESFHRSQSEDAISNSSFRMNGAALEEMMIADGHHMHSSPMAIRIGSGASHAFASGSSHGVRRTTSHGSLAHLDASNHSKMSYASARGGLPVQPYSRQGSYGASVNESPGKTGALGMAAGGYGGFPMQRQGPLPRTVSLGGGGGGARVGPYGGGAPRLMSIGRSRTYGDLEAAALQARAAYDGDMSGSYGARRPHSDVDPNEARAGFQLFPEVSTQSIEPEHGGDSGNNFKLFGDFQPLDIDLGPDSDDEEAPAAPAGGAQNGAAAAVQPPAAADQNGASSGSIDMSLPRESVVLSAGTGSPDDFTRGSSVDLTMFRRSSKGGSPSDAPQGTSDGSTSNAADLSTSISLGSSSLGKAISTALRHGHLSHQDNGTAAVRVSIEVPSEPLRRIEGWPGDGQKESSLGDAVPAAPAVEEKPPAKPPAVNLLPSVVSAPASTARRPSKPALKRVESAAALRLRSLFSSDGEGPGPSTEPAPTEKHMAVRVNSAPHAVVSNGAGAPVASPFEDQGLGSWGQVLSPRAEAAAKALNLPQTIVSGVVWHDEGHPRSQQEKRK